MSQHKFHTGLSAYFQQKQITAQVNISKSQFGDFHYQSSSLLALKKRGIHIDFEEVRSAIQNQFPGGFTKIELTGPGFISVKMAPCDFVKQTAKKQRVIVDYCGVNIAKKMHIGHIRSMFIGDFVARAHESNGDEVIRFNHIGDWGNQFGGLLAFLDKNPAYWKDNQTLTEAYKLAQSLQKENELFSVEAQETARKLLNKEDPSLIEAWDKLAQMSMSENYKVFDTLNLTLKPEHTCGESFYADKVQRILALLLDKGIATQNEDGSIVCFFENKTPLVLQKQNGNPLYALYDLAAISYRTNTFHPDRIVYVVDKRQALHFEQVFDVARRAGLTPDTTELKHLGFGAILGADGKPLKTKSGDSLYFDELFAEGMACVSKIPQMEKTPLAHQPRVSHHTLVGGMKFYDLKFNRNKDYAFSWENVLRFDGQSAPYLQNVVVRMDSLLFKSGLILDNSPVVDFAALTESQQKVWWAAYQCKELMNEIAQDYPSQLLCESIMAICQEFQSYYESTPILGNTDTPSHLAILSYATRTILEASKILGIQSYECIHRME